MAMFARISGSLDLVVDDGYSAVPPNSWMWTEQSVAASRRRLGCAPFQHPSSSSKGSSQAQTDHRGALLVCRAGRRQQQRQGQGSVKRTAMRRSTPGHFLRHASGSSSSSSFLQAQYPQPQQQQRQPPVDPAVLTACINAAVHYHELEALCNTFLHNQAFSSKHAAAVISRLHCVSSRRGSSQLLLVELLAAKLRSLASAAAAAAASCSSQQQQQQQPQLLDAADAASVCWGFARVGYQADAALLQQLLQQFWSSYSQQQQQQSGSSITNSSSSRHKDLAQLAAGLAGLGFRDPDTWPQLRAAAVAALPDLQPDSLQQLVWALATAQVSDAATTAAVAGAVMEKLEGFAAEQLAQVVWCLHVLGCESSELFEAAAQQMVHQIEGRQAAVDSSSSSHASSFKDRAAVAAAAPQQQQQRLVPLQRPPLPPQQQQHSSKLQQIVLQLPAQHKSHQHSKKQQHAAAAAVQGRLGRTAADLCSAAASQAYSVLEKYDPLLCTLALYRDYLQPAH